MNASVKIVSKKTPLKNGLYPIYLRVTINRKSKFYSTPFTCHLKEWDEKQGEFKNKYSNSNNFNKTLRKLKDEASDVINELENEFQSYNLILFDKFYSKRESADTLFVQFFNKEIDNYRNNGQVNYARSMGNSLTALNQFAKKLNDYKFESIDFQFLSDFERFLRMRGCNDGGIASYMRNIRTIYNRAIYCKVVEPQYYPFRDYKLSKLKKRDLRKALTTQEFNTFLAFDIESLPAAKNARYAYLFSYYARGMNFTDIAELKWSDLHDLSFRYNRNKTEALLKIKLPDIPIIHEMLNFYKVYRPYETPYIFPILAKNKNEYSDIELVAKKDNTRMYYNLQLKAILAACNIDKNITFYTARHTFATAALRNNVNINIIKQSLGHKRLSTTENYLDDFQDSEVDDVIIGIF